jgi:hypothetical protein
VTAAVLPVAVDPPADVWDVTELGEATLDALPVELGVLSCEDEVPGDADDLAPLDEHPATHATVRRMLAAIRTLTIRHS